MNDFTDKAVIVTGGTKGIGLATGLAFARHGAHLYLTHRWGSADEDVIRAKFAEIGAREPTILEADVSHDPDTVELFDRIKADHDGVDVFISNVCVVQPAQGLESYKKRSLLKSLEYSAWPFVAYLQQAKKTFGRLPRYAIGVSSDGADNYFSNYEYVATSKTVMETLCRYLSHHLRGEDIRMNCIRSRNVLTDAVDEIFGERYVQFMRDHAGEEYFMYPEDIGNAVLAMCSGMFDALNGQVLQVDKGMAFADTLMRQLELTLSRERAAQESDGEAIATAASAKAEAVAAPNIVTRKKAGELNDYDNASVLVTGATKGLGLAIASSFAKRGAQVILTHRWGSVDEDTLKKGFVDNGWREPLVLEADASYDDDTVNLLETIRKTHDSLDVFVSNVSFARVNKAGLTGLKKRHLFKSLEYSAWPFVGYMQNVKKVFGRYPRYSLATSCDGPETYYPGYDYVAVSKAIMETFCRYMGKTLHEEQGATVNVLRSRPVSTESLVATFGEGYEPFLRKWHSDDYFIELDQVGEAAFALCSGLMDAMTGQIVLLDKGVAFEDNLMRLFEQRERYDI